MAGMFSANLFGPDLGIVVVVIIAVLLAGSQAPKIARNLGSAGREFRKAQEEAEEQHKKEAAKAQTDDKVELTQSELNALLTARETQAKRERSDA